MTIYVNDLLNDWISIFRLLNQKLEVNNELELAEENKVSVTMQMFKNLQDLRSHGKEVEIFKEVNDFETPEEPKEPYDGTEETLYDSDKEEHKLKELEFVEDVPEDGMSTWEKIKKLSDEQVEKTGSKWVWGKVIFPYIEEKHGDSNKIKPWELPEEQLKELLQRIKKSIKS